MLEIAKATGQREQISCNCLRQRLAKWKNNWLGISAHGSWLRHRSTDRDRLMKLWHVGHKQCYWRLYKTTHIVSVLYTCACKWVSIYLAPLYIQKINIYIYIHIYTDIYIYIVSFACIGISESTDFYCFCIALCYNCTVSLFSKLLAL